MTIHADFIKILKQECGNAFMDQLPTALTPTIAFIDGQVKLMKPDAITSWSVFIKIQFCNIIEKAYNLGAHTVVLGFDDYRYVPEAKNMTQIKRNKTVPVMQFDAHDSLPNFLPDHWSSAMRNRNFKVKVIRKVLQDIETWFKQVSKENAIWKQRALILDFCDRPQVLQVSTSAQPVGKFVQEQPDDFWQGRGECDVKAFTWALPQHTLLIMSTDGDFVPMSLLQMQECHNSQQQILVHRLKINNTTQAENAKTAKRKLPTSETGDDKNTATRREYEFVNIQALQRWVNGHMPSKVASPIEQFCSMVAMCGCDFTMNLPRLGARTLWKYRHKLQNLNLTLPRHIVLAMNLMYYDMMLQKNVTPHLMQHSANLESIDEDTCKQAYQLTITRVQKNSTMSPLIKSCLWSGTRALAHGRNTAWTLQYWRKLQRYEGAHDQDYGYTKDTHGRTVFAFIENV